MEDIALSFAPGPFLAGLAAISGGIEKMNGSMDAFAQKSTQKTQKVKMSSFSLAKALGPVVLGYQALKKAISQIPELGRTFSIAGDIFSRNLLMPLRRELIPLLQKVLDWTRDNRARFLQWGNVLANVFRLIKTLITGFIDIAQKFWVTLSGKIEQIFGKTTKTVSEVINLILFKLAAVGIFAQSVLGSAMEFVANTIGAVAAAFKGLVSGMLSGIGDLGPEIGFVVDLFKDLFTWLNKGAQETSAISRAFEVLGAIIGSVVGPLIRGLVQTIDDLVTGLKMASLAIDKFQAWRKNDKQVIQSINQQMDMLGAENQKRFEDRMKRQMDAWKSAYKTIVNDTSQPVTVPVIPEIKKTSSFKIPLSSGHRSPTDKIILGRSREDSTPKKGGFISNIFKNQNTTTNQSYNNTNYNNKSVAPSVKIKKETPPLVNNDNRKYSIPINVKMGDTQNPKQVASEIESQLSDLLKGQQFRSGDK